MLRIEDVSKNFRKKQVLKGVSCEFQNGVYGLLGPNGAGKTTLFRCILNLYPYQGTISLDAEEDGEIPLIGYLPQKMGVFPNLTVEEQLQYFANLKEIRKEDVADEIDRVLQLTNLSEVRKVKGRKLSGGMVRRVGIAQALLNHPSLIIFDEPTTGLDPEERMRFKNLLREIGKESIVLLSTHIVEDVEAVCDRILILKDGCLAAKGTQEEISHIADGLVYEISKDDVLSEDYIEKEREADGEMHFRILTRRQLPDNLLQKPNVEDGYLCVLKEI